MYVKQYLSLNHQALFLLAVSNCSLFSLGKECMLRGSRERYPPEEAKSWSPPGRQQRLLGQHTNWMISQRTGVAFQGSGSEEATPGLTKHKTC